ncbi:unnamed protein product [Clonostachys solani]|uniref:Alcohol dehydrogenase iron-type/glycerol dehydrogenase GldA domain-containing protein n=1 Tax=Clonostachys solani TaxID=160281 RepID=A0A9N9Z7R5_9HYPO|nr:unnamed protein product [Clonostachys solani]
MDSFEYNESPSRIVFGNGSLKKVINELDQLSLSKPLVLSTPNQIDHAQQLVDILQGKAVGIFTEATMHTPAAVTDKAIDYAKSRGADCVVSIGGGSTIGLGKAISLALRNVSGQRGSFNLSHAETHTALLPHALSYNALKVPEAMRRLALVLPGSNGDAIHGLNVLLAKLQVSTRLRDLGMKEEDIDRAADIATSNSYWNPREIERGPIRELIRRAWAGEPARADLEGI